MLLLLSVQNFNAVIKNNNNNKLTFVLQNKFKTSIMSIFRSTLCVCKHVYTDEKTSYGKFMLIV